MRQLFLAVPAEAQSGLRMTLMTELMQPLRLLIRQRISVTSRSEMGKTAVSQLLAMGGHGGTTAGTTAVSQLRAMGGHGGKTAGKTAVSQLRAMGGHGGTTAGKTTQEGVPLCQGFICNAVCSAV